MLAPADSSREPPAPPAELPEVLLAALLRRGDLRGCSEIEQGNCCINVLDFDMRDADDVREVALNFRDHWPAAAV